MNIRCQSSQAQAREDEGAWVPLHLMDEIVIHDIKVIYNEGRLFVAMLSRRTSLKGSISISPTPSTVLCVSLRRKY